MMEWSSVWSVNLPKNQWSERGGENKVSQCQGVVPALWPPCLTPLAALISNTAALTNKGSPWEHYNVQTLEVVTLCGDNEGQCSDIWEWRPGTLRDPTVHRQHLQHKGCLAWPPTPTGPKLGNLLFSSSISEST